MVDDHVHVWQKEHKYSSIGHERDSRDELVAKERLVDLTEAGTPSIYKIHHGLRAYLDGSRGRA